MSTLCVRDLRPTEALLGGVLGFRREAEFREEGGRLAVWECGPGGAGAEVHLLERPDLPPARPGRGGVHHVAFRTADDEEQRAWRERIARAGVPVSPLIDRFYFQSIYFREPNGILFEIATDGPGFATDEAEERLGERLSLPPALEPERARIEAGLRPLRQPGEWSASTSASSR